MKLVFLSLTWLTPFFRIAKFACFGTGLATCYLGMTRQIGKIEFSKEFLQKALSNEFGVSIFFFLAIVSVPVLTPLNWLPVSAHFLIGASEFIIRGGYKLLQHPKALDFSVKMRVWKNDVKIAKGYIELFTIFYYLAMALLGRFSILIVFIYGHYVKFKYKLNGYTKYAVDQTRSQLKLKVQAVPGLGKFIAKGVDGIFWLITF